MLYQIHKYVLESTSSAETQFFYNKAETTVKMTQKYFSFWDIYIGVAINNNWNGKCQAFHLQKWTI